MNRRERIVNGFIDYLLVEVRRGYAKLESIIFFLIGVTLGVETGAYVLIFLEALNIMAYYFLDGKADELKQKIDEKHPGAV